MVQDSVIYFVGSIPFENAEMVFRALAEKIGSKAARYPDGETGPRRNWIRWQRTIFDENPDFRVSNEKLPAHLKGAEGRVLFALREPISENAIELQSPGYAKSAVASYQTFRRLKAAGVIPPKTRLQVSMPTSLALLSGFVDFADRAKCEPAMEAAMKREVDAMAAAIPPDELAIQWDIAFEIIGFDGGYRLHIPDILTQAVERIARHVDWIPKKVEAGIHLCYGDSGHEHLVQPKDLATCVKFANAIFETSRRPIAWLHMPVPRNRSDDAYFAPLANLRLPQQTEFFLGLIHYTDGISGTAQRIAAARRAATSFGIATECGFGRRDPATIPALLELHRQALELLA